MESTRILRCFLVLGLALSTGCASLKQKLGLSKPSFVRTSKPAVTMPPKAQPGVAAPVATQQVKAVQTARPLKPVAQPKPAVPPPATKKPVVQAPPAPAPLPAGPAPKGPSASQRQLQQKIYQFDKTMAEQRKIQAQLSNQLLDAQQRMIAAQAQVRDLEKRAGEAYRRLEQAEAALAQLKGDVDRQYSLLPGSQATQTISKLQAALGDETRRRQEQQVVLDQRTREVQDLRAALAARDAMLKEQSRTAGPKPAPVPVKPAATVQAKPVQMVASVAPAAAAAPAKATSAAPPAAVAAPVKAVAPAPQAAARPAATMTAAQMVVEGNRLLRAHRTGEAENLFTAALSGAPTAVMAEAKAGLAACRYAAGNLLDAKRLVAEALRAQPGNVQAIGLSGIVAWREGDLGTATRMLSLAIRKEPREAQWHNYMGIVWYARNKPGPALRELNKALELDPNSTEAHFNLAVMLATDNPPRLEVARQHYQAALALGAARDPKLEKILYP